MLIFELYLFIKYSLQEGHNLVVSVEFFQVLKFLFFIPHLCYNFINHAITT